MSCVQHSFCSHPLLSLSRHPCFRLVKAGLASLRVFISLGAMLCEAVVTTPSQELHQTPNSQTAVRLKQKKTTIQNGKTLK